MQTTTQGMLLVIPITPLVHPSATAPTEDTDLEPIFFKLPTIFPNLILLESLELYPRSPPPGHEAHFLIIPSPGTQYPLGDEDPTLRDRRHVFFTHSPVVPHMSAHVRLFFVLCWLD